MKIIDDQGRIYEPIQKGEQIILKKEMIDKNVDYVEVLFDEWEAVIGEPGYYVIADYERFGSYLCYFQEKEERELIVKQNMMPILGVKNKQGCYLVIVHGMKNVFYVRTRLELGKYQIAARFLLQKEIPYEDISFSIASLGMAAEYSDMATYYRNYQLTYGGCIPLKERVKKNPYLSYSVDSVQIRIRMGWKPAPATVLEQTIENEPEMKVACTFERVKDIIDELKRQGVDKAELCLVGWNKSGHDGRWPQMFPVEETLGGEKKLRELIQYAQGKGYQITCHTNSTDCYQIAEDFAEDIVVKTKEGNLAVYDSAWSGGRMYHMCPVKALEYAQRDLPKVAELGFRGIHYIDVMSIVPLRKCYDPNHPVTEADTERIYEKIGLQCRELFGGYSSEGSFDFAASYLDYAFYVSFPCEQEVFFDREIPLWQMVYHGIILSNTSTETVNYPLKSKDRRLKVLEYGGRPTFYFYSKFMTNSSNADWLGKEDMECNTDEQLRNSVAAIRSAYEEYKTKRHLQYEFITKHEKKAEGVYEVTYSDGTVEEINYRIGEE